MEKLEILKKEEITYSELRKYLCVIWRGVMLRQFCYF
jgi:hypothetical protein